MKISIFPVNRYGIEQTKLKACLKEHPNARVQWFQSAGGGGESFTQLTAIVMNINVFSADWEHPTDLDKPCQKLQKEVNDCLEKYPDATVKWFLSSTPGRGKSHTIGGLTYVDLIAIVTYN